VTKPLLSVVLPTLNERENIGAMYAALKAVVDAEVVAYEFIFVDDNSEDGTIALLEKLHERDPCVKYIIMSRRYGDQACLMAGLRASSGQVVVTMDADLQHPPAYIGAMLAKWREGYDVVAMRRETAGHESWFKRWTELRFYDALAKLSNAPIIPRFAGYALLDRKVVRALSQFEERDPFLRGLIASVGFRRADMLYEEGARPAGRSKFSLQRLLKLALTGVTSFSTVPLYFAFWTGLAALIGSGLGAFAVALATLIRAEIAVRFWLLVIGMAAFAGLQLCATGLLGVYVGKLLREVRKRPSYIVARTGGFPGE
jgi:dolichol-phosphate mannosyltransferase